MQKQLVFIDESGDAGFDIPNGASSFFAIGVVVLKSTESAQKLSSGIAELKQSLKITTELKFSKASHERRLFYIDEINKHDFFCRVIVVNKGLITSHTLRTKPRMFYNFILKQVLTHSSINEAKVVLDGKGNKHFVAELKSYLNKGTNQKIKTFSLKDSKKDNLLQVADTITSAVAWGYKNNNHCYLDRLNKEKITVWEFK